MGTRKFYQSCLFSGGLLTAVFAVACNALFGQVGPYVGQSEGIVLVRTASMIDLPLEISDQDSIPSQATGSSQQSLGASVSANQSPTESKAATQSASKPGDSISPMQNRELNVRVQAVSLSYENIGTGLVPKTGVTRSSEQLSMPTGFSRGMQYTHVCWRASNIQHFPLCFEDAMLERHGHTRCCLGFECTQSLVSGAKFFGTIPLIPYLATLRPKHQCVYALGQYRPGSGAPCLRDNIPYDSRAVIVESASAALFFWGIPF